MHHYEFADSSDGLVRSEMMLAQARRRAMQPQNTEREKVGRC